MQLGKLHNPEEIILHNHQALTCFKHLRGREAVRPDTRRMGNLGSGSSADTHEPPAMIATQVK